MNVALLLEIAAELVGDRVAATDGRRAVTFVELLERARRWAAWIDARAAGRPLFYLGPSRVEMVEVLFGCAIAGSTFVPANYRSRSVELAACLGVEGSDERVQ